MIVGMRRLLEAMKFDDKFFECEGIFQVGEDKRGLGSRLL
jgi:hypothetical protein